VGYVINVVFPYFSGSYMEGMLLVTNQVESVYSEVRAIGGKVYSGLSVARRGLMESIQFKTFCFLTLSAIDGAVKFYTHLASMDLEGLVSSEGMVEIWMYGIAFGVRFNQIIISITSIETLYTCSAVLYT